MQQEGGRRSDQEDMKPNKQPQQQPPPQQQHPQKCPRCDSLNTKFCYYNNYSLSQPRYFCKACRRYWTQGGTLRNVPVGGGCRKGKRAKTSSSATTSSGTTSTTNNTSHIASIATGGAVGANKETDGNSVVRTPHPPTGFSPMGFGSFSYPAIGGGFLSSLAAIQSFAHPGVGGINLGGDLRGRATGGSSSDLGLLMHGFNSNTPPPAPLLAHHFGSQLQGQQPITRQFYHSGGDGDTSSKSTPSTSTITLVGQGPPALSYPQEESLIQSRRVPESVSTVAASSSFYQPQLNWPHHQGFTYPNLSDTSLWSISTTTTTTTSSTVGSSSMNPNQWHDLPGYDPPQS